jgi:GNAT superfamily N-acetyltransferase
MPPVQQVGLEEMLQRYDGAATSLDEFTRQRADAHLIAPAARCSIWWLHVPQLPNQKVGLIGHFEARDEPSARAILHSACDHLKDHGCTLAIGPMDGSTWNRYRLINDFGTEPPFFLEPWNPPRYPWHFLDAGFSALATYSSALNTNLTYLDPRSDHILRRIDEAGIFIRKIDPMEFEAELKRIYSICLISFRNNFLYTPISEADFLRQYAKVRPILDSNLVLIAMQNAQPVGFLFALPDILSRQRNGPPTIIFKTLAILPQRAQAGLGGLLIAECQRIARELGYQRSIFALMHDSNASRSISSRYAAPMRRYTLFSKTL